MKYLIILILFLNYLNANNLNILGNSDNIQTENIEEKKYSDILAFLEKQGDGESLFYLSSFYLNGSDKPDSEGKTVPKNTELAKKYLEKSVQLKYPFSAITLGSLYLYHEDFIVEENNIEKAEKFLNISLEQEVFEAYTILADIYFNFKGDAQKAVNYLSEGASHEIATSQYALAVIYNSGINSETFSIEKNELISSKYLTDACLNNKKTKKLEEICSSQIVIKEKIED